MTFIFRFRYGTDVRLEIHVDPKNWIGRNPSASTMERHAHLRMRQIVADPDDWHLDHKER